MSGGAASAPVRSAKGRTLTEGSNAAPVIVLRRMKIAVCVKVVPEPSAARRIDPGTKRLDRSGEAVLNAFDVKNPISSPDSILLSNCFAPNGSSLIPRSFRISSLCSAQYFF